MRINKNQNLFEFFNNIVDNDIIDNIIGMKLYVMLLKKDTTILYYCKNFNDLIGQDLTNKKLSDICRKRLYDEIRKTILESIFTNSQSFNEILKDGKYYKIAITPLINDEDNVEYLLLSGYNITSNKKIEQEILNFKNKISESETIKSVFLANISHELKTPMNAILGFSDILLDGIKDKHNCQGLKNVSYLKSINSNSKYLDELLNNILDYSKIESGVFDILYENFSVNDMFDELEDLFKYINYNKNLNFVKLEFIKNEDIKIISDYLRLKQVLFNLISNSIKFTERGNIKVSYIVCKKYITFKVEDTGIGIPEDKIKFIFDRFYQCDSSSTKKHKGAGLGLSICKSITNLLDGQMYVKSTLGKGSNFYVKLTLEEIQDLSTTETIDRISFSGMTIMVVDELPINYSLLGLYLNNLQIDVIPAYSGKESVDIFREKHKMIDCVILDLNLPDIKTNDVIQNLKSISNCKIITKSINNRKIKKTNYHINKPINKDRLILILNELWQK